MARARCLAPFYCQLVMAFLLAGLPSHAQERYPHHNFTVGIGGAMPTGDSKKALNSSPLVTVSYGYRFLRYLQADVGLQVAFGAARVSVYLQTGIGPFRIRDREYMVPMGGRAILPLKDGRILLSAGGGGIYLRYAEAVRQPSFYFRVDCPICTSRSGWGAYEMADFSYFLDRSHVFRVGVTAQFIQAHTNGEPLGEIPAMRTTDRWTNLFASFGFSF